MNSSTYLRVLSIITQIVSPVLLQELINDFAVCKHCSGTVTCLEAVAQRCSVKKGILRNLAKFTGKHLCQSLFFNSMFEKLYYCETEIDFI